MSDSTSTYQINEIFYRPINRKIDRVVKVDNDDPSVVKKELEEYILTPQLERHFSDALEAVIDTEHAQTEDVGMWVSGFFGSGKSHFMKILGHVMENRAFGDTHAAEMFRDRIEGNEMLDGAVSAVTNKFESEVLMFQIGAKADASGSESITEIIHREFNISRGYASMPWVAQMEQELESRGVYDDFVTTIEANTGKDWTEARKDAMFVRSDMETALVEATNEFDDEEDAARAIDDVQDNVLINASTLAEDIVEYVEQQERETGNNCRYFVFIDEISQFIGDDGQLLLELQSIVEEFGQKGKGKVFLGVTSQEQLQQLIPGVLEKEAEESKVIDRFPHRFDLTSENLDKVVRDRVLSKKGEVREEIGTLYDEHEGILSARYKLDAGQSLKPITRENFIDCYPFLPYQLDILPEMFKALGKGSDDQLAGSERTLIDVTQSVLKDETHLYNEDLGALVTLDMIFDEISNDIPSSDVKSIREATPKDADTEIARRVLKSLYLLQQLAWIPNTADNIATSLQTELGPTQQLESEVKGTLDSLVEAGLVGRSEEGYRFLRETERELENEIKSIEVGPGDIRRSSKRFLNDILNETSRVNYEGKTFQLNLSIDGEVVASNGHIDLKTYSPIYQRYEDLDPDGLKTQSFSEDGTLYWIADDEKQHNIFEKLKSIYQINTVVKAKRGNELSQEEQEALGQKQEDLQRLRNEVEREFKRSFQRGTLIYNGDAEEFDTTNTSLTSLVSRKADNAIPKVFPSFKHGSATVKGRHIEQIFGDLQGSSNPSVFSELGVVQDGELIAEARISAEVEDDIQRREKAGESRSGSDLIDHFAEPPYGWSREVVRLAAAVLFRNGSIIPTHKERTYETYSEDGAQELFTQVTKFKSTSFDERETVDVETRTDAKQLLDRLFDRKVKSTDQAVDEGVREAANEWVSTTSTLLSQLQRVDFPLADDVEDFQTRLQNLLQQPTSAKRIKQFVEYEDELEGLTKTAKDVAEFCGETGGENRLETYETIQRFITTEWESLVDEADSHPGLVDISDEAREAAQRVADTLDTEGVISQWNNVKTDYRTAAEAFTTTYEALYEERHETYTDSVEAVRAYAGSDVDEPDLDAALSDLTKRQGEGSVDLNIAGEQHINPSPSLPRLIEHIQTVDAYENAAKTEIDDLEDDEDDGTLRESVHINSIFGSVVVTDPDDIDAPISELRAEIEDLLDQDGDVEIRFR
ncbi:BREX system P-loop protein BrxC [Natrialbaceae archaeon AArc-T1-2]|uniref:BREX system P-loop protein BrxC n=1 Tax=Natrialbaceae archaeon AArc-T1-2 TaxID=3053904 RepID=UPI00255B3900|nr:BREX system P-loop protein BrxC [Natrialbaceae archaeon AArc-T1-2]WIV67351.1 BREX system P-loop protein BrxC [Natrialbaceae archaeon AArc-T1-2]